MQSLPDVSLPSDVLEVNRLTEAGASYEADALDLIMQRFGDSICRSLFKQMVVEGISFEQACHSFGLRCLDISTGLAYAKGALARELIKNTSTDEAC